MCPVNDHNRREWMARQTAFTLIADLTSRPHSKDGALGRTLNKVMMVRLRGTVLVDIAPAPVAGTAIGRTGDTGCSTAFRGIG
jgi:hypothetical protein